MNQLNRIEREREMLSMENQMYVNVFKVLCQMDILVKCTEVDGTIVITGQMGNVLVIENQSIQYNKRYISLMSLVSLFGDSYEYLHLEEEDVEMVESSCQGHCSHSCGGCHSTQPVEPSVACDIESLGLHPFIEETLKTYLTDDGDLEVVAAIIEGILTRAEAKPERYYSDTKLAKDFPGVVRPETDLSEEAIMNLIKRIKDDAYVAIGRIKLALFGFDAITCINCDEIEEVYDALEVCLKETIITQHVETLSFDEVKAKLVEHIQAGTGCKDKVLTTLFVHHMAALAYSISNKLDFFLRKLEDAGAFSDKEKERFLKLLDKESKPAKKRTRKVVLVDDTIEEHIATIRNDIEENTNHRASSEDIAIYQARFDEEVKGMTSEDEITQLGQTLIEEILNNHFDVTDLKSVDQMDNLVAKMYDEKAKAKSIKQIQQEYNEEMGIEFGEEQEETVTGVHDIEKVLEQLHTVAQAIEYDEVEIYGRLFKALEVDDEVLDQLDDVATSEELLAQLGLSYDDCSEEARQIMDEIDRREAEAREDEEEDSFEEDEFDDLESEDQDEEDELDLDNIEYEEKADTPEDDLDELMGQYSEYNEFDDLLFED